MNGDIHLKSDICIFEALLSEEVYFFLLQGELINGIVQQRVVIFGGLRFLPFLFRHGQMIMEARLFLFNQGKVPDGIKRMVPGNDEQVSAETFQFRKDRPFFPDLHKHILDDLFRKFS